MQHNSIDMGHIFQTCPRLQSLQLDSPSTLYLQGNWVGSTPHTKHLQLRNLRRQDSGEGYSWNRLYKCLVSLALPLQSIHFSDLGQQPTDDAQEAQQNVLMICPHATECSFWTSNLTPILRQCLQKLPNVVTTQNLVTKSVNQPNKGLALHQFLCESPHLLRLKASQSFCLVERMDPFDRWMPLPRYGEDAYRQPGIWMAHPIVNYRLPGVESSSDTPPGCAPTFAT
ncbi:hypothetical protein BGZ88_002151 [Linnemannia elongata]|nr:hypothetical protein BGZ88_002151 [Linnemannia elongata]